MATKTIGTGGDYSTYASYVTYLQTLGTLSAPETGQQLNEELSVTNLAFSGFTPSAASPWVLEAAAGASFRDHANKATNALRYNAANGAAIWTTWNYGTVVYVQVPYATIRNLQIGTTGAGSPLGSQFDVGNITFDNLILQNGGWSGGWAVGLGGNNDKLRNSIIIITGSNTHIPITLERSGQVDFCTFVRPSNQTPNGAMCRSSYGTATFNNCVWSGFSSASSPAGGGAFAGSNNATSHSSFPTGVSGTTGLTPSTEFEQTSNASGTMDFRLKSTSAVCKDNGSTDSTNGAVDIIGTTRPQGSAYDIGCWELVAAGGGQTFANPFSLLGVGRAL